MDTCDVEDPRDYTLVVPLVASDFILKFLDFNRLKTTTNVNYIQIFSSYRAVTLLVSYTNRSVNAV